MKKIRLAEIDSAEEVLDSSNALVQQNGEVYQILLDKIFKKYVPETSIQSIDLSEDVDISTLNGAYEVTAAGKIINSNGASLQLSLGAIINTDNDNDYVTVLTSTGSYALLKNADDWETSYCITYDEAVELIPTNVSELDNDSGYQDTEGVTNIVNEAVDGLVDGLSAEIEDLQNIVDTALITGSNDINTGTWELYNINGDGSDGGNTYYVRNTGSGIDLSKYKSFKVSCDEGYVFCYITVDSDGNKSTRTGYTSEAIELYPETGYTYKFSIGNTSVKAALGETETHLHLTGITLDGYTFECNTAFREEVEENGISPEQTDFFDISENLFNPETVSVGSILKTTGSLSTSFTAWRATDYIPIKANVTYYFSNDGEAYQLSTCALYDENKKFIAGYGNDVEGAFNYGYSITAEQDCYLRVSKNAEFPEKFQIEANEITEYKEYGNPVIKLKSEYIPPVDISDIPEQSVTNDLIADEAITPDKTTFFDNLENLFNPETVSVGAILKTTGSLSTSFTAWRATDYIPIKANVTYYFSNDGNAYQLSTCALYDENKKFIAGYGNDVEGAFNYGYSITAEQDCYLRVSKNAEFPEKFQIQAAKITDYKEYDIDDYKLKTEYIPDEIGNTTAAYENKRILILGDSITAFTGNTGWVQYFKPLVNPSVCVNVAVAGATWHDKEANQEYDGDPKGSEVTGNVIGNQVQKVINNYEAGESDYSDFDVIIIAAGTNDTLTADDTIDNVDSQFVSAYGSGGAFTAVPLEDVNRQLVAGAMRYTYETLVAIYPNAIFAVCTPLQECMESYASIYNKGELIEYIASRLSINCWNSRDCGILNIYESSSENGRDLCDGLHPNENGAKKLGEYNAREFRRLFD